MRSWDRIWDSFSHRPVYSTSWQFPMSVMATDQFYTQATSPKMVTFLQECHSPQLFDQDVVSTRQFCPELKGKYNCEGFIALRYAVYGVWTYYLKVCFSKIWLLTSHNWAEYDLEMKSATNHKNLLGVIRWPFLLSFKTLSLKKAAIALTCRRGPPNG